MRAEGGRPGIIGSPEVQGGRTRKTGREDNGRARERG